MMQQITVTQWIQDLFLNSAPQFSFLETLPRVMTRGGFGSGGSGFGQIRCPSVENKLTDYPSANRPLIGSGGRVG
jgi:hypothetical protein